MADAPAQDSAPPPATVADVMQPPLTTVEQNDHVAAAAYLMKRANATALIVTQAQTGRICRYPGPDNALVCSASLPISAAESMFR